MVGCLQVQSVETISPLVDVQSQVGRKQVPVLRPTPYGRPLTTQTYRRARHSVSLLHAHLVFVTKYRRPVFTGHMLTFCEHTLRAVCAEIDVVPVEFNGEADHVHLLVAYPPT
jgi:Transposase IS200 like